MAAKVRKTDYLPGYYPGRYTDAVLMAEEYVRRWEKSVIAKNSSPASSFELPPTICFSRKIGSGALEIAEILGQRILHRVADRMIIEQIANTADLSKKTVRHFDERYPGKLFEAGTYLFAEKSFVMSAYVKQLFSTVYALAEAEPTIFVGRGAHLILPRGSVLAIRIICSNDRRVARLADILKISKKEAATKLDEIDREQRDFFKKTFAKKDAASDEFDLVINCDHIRKPRWAASIVEKAFAEKFTAAVKQAAPAPLSGI
ncbi:MAG: hypothetical protein AMJ54_16780 [Deltaproteobacteria bacterium SG8_13]|nr:MAG: hypothetical protein AMJ54_16780 [Deltaproteobacteria bacterium SG8_13]